MRDVLTNHSYSAIARILGRRVRQSQRAAADAFSASSGTELQESFQIAAGPRRERELAINGPGEHRAAKRVLDQEGEPCRIALPRLACSDGFLKRLAGFSPDHAELGPRDDAKLGRPNREDLRGLAQMTRRLQREAALS